MTMTYYSSTFSSTASNPPVLIASGFGSKSTQQESGTLGWLHGNSLWFYSSTNAPSDVAGVAAITDGRALGMRVGDVMIGVTGSGGSTTPYPWLGVIVASAASTDPGGYVSAAGAQIGSNYAT